MHITPKGMSLTPGERTAFLNHEISAKSQRFLQAVEHTFQSSPLPEISAQKSPHFSGGICYCTKEEMEEFTQMVVRFFEKRLKIVRKHGSMIIIIGVLALVILLF